MVGMKLNSDIVHTLPRDAATVVMIRDGTRGLEVFLLKRHGLSDVLGGAYVFPGGKLDRADRELNMQVHLDQSLPDLHAALVEPATDALTAAALHVAAVRESLEESGVLFATGATAVHAMQATALLRTGLAFDAVLVELGLRLQTRSLVPWSRWITPKVPTVTNKRFDTRFFMAQVPADQIARHDNHEATASVWLSPRAALAQYCDGDIELAPPQIMSLAHLSRFADVNGAIAAARSRPPPLIEPESFVHEGDRVICYPGDARHSLRARALPGPTRLRYVNQRFEPEGGFDALFVD